MGSLPPVSVSYQHAFRHDLVSSTFLTKRNRRHFVAYAILVDDEVKKVVIVVRGTRSLEDLVMDLQYIPFSLEKVGNVCGFEGKGHWCHQGFLTRSKWIFNDIKK